MMDLIGEPGTRELGYSLVLFGTALLATVFAIQTVILRRRLRFNERRNRQIEELAFVDPLTRLPNRRLLLDRLQRALFAAERWEGAAAIYFLDLDEFKVVNERFGPDVGDQVLTELADRWAQEIRTGDSLARWGGDEFVIVTEDVASMEEVRAVVGRLQHALEEPFIVGDQEVTITVSAGIALGCQSTENPADLVKCADAAMYRGKRSGDPGEHEIVGIECCFLRLPDSGPTRITTPGSQYVRTLS